MGNPGASRTRLRDRVRRAADPVLVGCTAVMIAFSIAASVAANRQPRPPPASDPIEVPPGDGASESLRDVPVFSADPPLAGPMPIGTAMERTVRRTLVDTFGSRRGRALARIAASSDAEVDEIDTVDVEQIPYPFRYPPIDRVLEGAHVDPGTGSDAAALLILAAAGDGGSDSVDNDFPNGAKVAFAILDRARADGDCVPQLNLAFLLSADRNPRDDDVAREYGVAARVCARDPTPLWLLGQFQSQRAFAYDNNDRPGQQLDRAERLRRPFATFKRLRRAWPRSPLGWAGEADAELRLAYQIDRREPFGARRHFRRALALYRAARRLDAGSRVGGR